MKQTSILKAKVQLILEHPFFATLALRLPFEIDESIETAATDGTRIIYNPAFMESLTLAEAVGVLVHEVMHITLLHHVRRGNRNPERWNDACDYAINPLLLTANIKLPVNHLYKAEYVGKSAEQIYDLLPPKSSAAASCGVILDLPDNCSKQEEEMKIDIRLTEALMVARKQGKAPAFMERIVDQRKKAKIQWKDILSKFICEVILNDYTWTKPSRRSLSSGGYLPSIRPSQIGTIAIIVDTSGSIDDVTLALFTSEIMEITKLAESETIVIYVDAKVQGVERFTSQDQIVLHPKGGGGTNFKPGFKYLSENEIECKAIVYLTDGLCSSFPEEPLCPVLWAHFPPPFDFPFKPPFGDVIELLFPNNK
ncbi:VWA-like domain-containing protein [Chitinophaga sp. sic0106]|uniref:vWA domain-containing protein n=1 Tax=Chitinophaga sp. sic0106 TaxID=2854785 RepID=UPI001C4559A2|nr:VWA-like domain-containing protein [Chitinophaga sp. sic0106]MBV7531004.1 hypothetical protein [Chitinophaga sp. sic0106]